MVKYRHKKRGTTYEILGPGRVLCSEPFLDDEMCEVYRDTLGEGLYVAAAPGLNTNVAVSIGQARVQCEEPLLDGEEIIVYQDINSLALGVRPRDEFYDGRFEELK